MSGVQFSLICCMLMFDFHIQYNLEITCITKQTHAWFFACFNTGQSSLTSKQDLPRSRKPSLRHKAVYHLRVDEFLTVGNQLPDNSLRSCKFIYHIEDICSCIIENDSRLFVSLSPKPKPLPCFHGTFELFLDNVGTVIRNC